MKDSKSRHSTMDVLAVWVRVSEPNCRFSWQDWTSCLVLLPQHLDLMILMYGGSGTDQVLSRNIVARPTSIAGLTGQIFLRPSTPLQTMVSIVIAAGHTEYTIMEVPAQMSLDLDFCVFPRPSRSLGLLPRSLVRISGVNKICGTTSVAGPEDPGLGDLFVLTINLLIRNSAFVVPGMARLLRSIYRPQAIVSAVMLLGRCFGKTRDS